MVEKSVYSFPKEQLYLREKIEKDKLYSFSDFLGILKKEYPDVKGSKVNKWLENLEIDGDIVKIIDPEKGVFFRSTKGLEKAYGIVEWQTRGHGLLYVTDKEKNKTGELIFLPRTESALVINGEFIKVKRIPSKWRGKDSTEDEGLVVEVLETRPHKTIAKVVENTKTNWHGAVKILEPMLVSTIKISERYEEVLPKEEAVEINKEGNFLFGELRRSGGFERWSGIRGFFDPIKKIGTIEDKEIETRLAIAWMGIKEGFSEEAMEEANEVSKISVQDLLRDKGRKDLRYLHFVTIDGNSTRDFDDAVYIEKNEDGYRLLVAISDVSRYVKPNGSLDIEAKEKGSSYYMPHRVIPMLPEIISQESCSLNINCARAVMVLDCFISKTGAIESSEFYPAVINNYGRLTYNEVDYFYNRLPEDAQTLGKPNRSPSVEMQLIYYNIEGWNLKYGETIKSLIECTTLLNNHRSPAPFDREPEVNYVLNSQGKISSLYVEQESPAQKIIEQCMLLTNRSAAEILSNSGTESVLFRNQVGPEEGQDFLRSAKYESVNVGHYGLGDDFYMHFTSPIRRYPDLMAHRELKNVLGFSEYDVPKKEETDEIGVNCTERQRLAKGATIKSDNWLLVQFADTIKKQPEKGIILRELEKGWVVLGEKTNIKGYISKPRDKAEEEAVLKTGLYFEVDRVDFESERILLRLKAPMLNNEVE